LAELRPDGQLSVYFVFGNAVTVTGLNGTIQTISRPGFAVSVAGPGAAPSAPFRAPALVIGQLLTQLDGRAGGNGGAAQIPTDVSVVRSAISNVVSGNVTESVQQAIAQRPVATAPTATNAANLAAYLRVGTVQSQGDPTLRRAIILGRDEIRRPGIVIPIP